MIKIPLPEPEISSGEYSGKYKEYKFDTANDFYNVLSNFDTIVDEQKNWIFRGHWNSDSWGLIPSVFRKEWQEKLILEPFKLIKNTPKITNPQNINLIKTNFGRKTKNHAQLKYQIMLEYDLLKKFIDIVNSFGIEIIPSFDHHKETIKKAFSETNIKELEKWPYADVESSMALAQHHGVPTRLLDFTYNPLLAAFFASSYPFFEEYIKKNKKDKKDKRLCVWAIKPEIFKKKYFKIIHRTIKNSKHIKAQEGLLILDKKASQKFEASDKSINNKKWWDFQNMGTPDTFRKFSLPQSQYKELLRLLSEDDMTPAKTKPNLDNIIQTMEYIQWLWAKKYNSIL